MNSLYVFHVRVRTPGSNEVFQLEMIHRKEFVSEFWQVWRYFRHGLLYLADENEPFTDLGCPLELLDGDVFEFRPWTPNYEHLRAEVEALPMDGQPMPYLPM